VRVRRAMTVAAVALGTALLAGCAGQPGTAAVVDGRTFTDAQVARAADELGPYLANSSPDAVLSAIVQSEIGLAVTEAHGVVVTEDQARVFLDTLAEQAGAEPADWGRESLAIARLQVAGQQLAEQGDETIAADFTRALAEVPVTVNPRYGVYDGQSGRIAQPERAWIVAPSAGE